MPCDCKAFQSAVGSANVPQVGGTRTPLYELLRCPPNILKNFNVDVLGYLGLMEAHEQTNDYDSLKKVRHAGQVLCRMSNLLFIQLVAICGSHC